MSKTIVLLSTLDTKGIELGYVREQIRAQGYETVLIDVGTLGAPLLEPDIGRERLAEAAGVRAGELAQMRQEDAVELMAEEASKVVQELYRSGRLDGILALGGSMGTSIAGPAMQVLPVGVPKVIVSTVASGDVSLYVGTRDITMISSVADIAGLNRVTRRLLSTAAGAVVGMVGMDPGPSSTDKPLIAASIRGDKLPCLNMVREILEEHGCEVVAFPAVGSGGRALEEWAAEGVFEGVFDLAPAEVTDHLFGGLLDAGPDRLEAAGRRGIPQLIVPGSVHLLCFSGEDAIPQHRKARKRRTHGKSMITTWLNSEETALVGRVVAEKLNKAIGPTAVIIPKGGFGGGGWEGDPESEAAFAEALKKHLKPEVKFVEVAAHVNDRMFAEQAAALLLELLHQH